MSWTPILRTFPFLASCDQGIINSCKCYHGGRMDGRGRSDKASFTPSIFIVIGTWRRGVLCLVRLTDGGGGGGENAKIISSCRRDDSVERRRAVRTLG